MMRRLVDDDRARLIDQLREHCCPLFFLSRQKRLKRKPSGRLPRHRECCDTCRRSRQRRHLNPFLIADAHEVFPRIRDPRRPRIRNQCDVESFAHLIHQLIRFLDLIVLVIARHRRPDLKMIQQLDGISGILRRNQIDFL